MLLIILSLAGIALILSLSITPLVRTLAIRWNLVDLPGTRKVHKNPIPRVGGVAVTAAYFGACLIVGAVFMHFRPNLPIAFSTIKSIAPATLLIFVIGLADDVLNLKPWQKLAVQIAASLLVISSGVHMGHSYLFVGKPILARVATVVWLLVCTNAVNLIDGLDGLASGIALLATSTVLVASVMSGNFELTIATAPLAGALIGFLVFNSNPASIFLGDSGSLVLGFLLGCFSLLWSAKSATLLGMTAPLMALAVPLIDTSLAITRRFLRGQPIFSPDRSHIHHRLLDFGLTHRKAVLSLYCAGLIASLLSLSLIWARSHGEAIVLLAFISVAVFGIEKLGYAELSAARKILLRGWLVRRAISAQLEVQNLQDGLRLARTAEDCWAAVQRNSSRVGFEIVRMRIGGEIFGQIEATAVLSTIRIGISEQDWVDLSLDTDLDEQPNMLMPFVTTGQKILADKRISLVGWPDATTAFSAVFRDAVSPTIQ